MGHDSIQRELLALRDDKGFIKPATVVNWAKENPESDLHKRFEWNNRRAAERYRLSQARWLIAVYIRTEDGHRTTISLRQDRNESGGYRDLGAVLSTAELRSIALKQALDEFNRWKEKYLYLSELARIFEAGAAVKEDLTPAAPFETADVTAASETAGA